MNIDTSGAAEDLRKLAIQIEQTQCLDDFQCEFSLEDLHDREELISLTKSLSQIRQPEGVIASVS